MAFVTPVVEHWLEWQQFKNQRLQSIPITFNLIKVFLSLVLFLS